MRAKILAGVWASIALAACGDKPGADPSRSTTDQAAPPIHRGDWTYYGPGQGLSQDVQDVSADEGGNVYVAGGDALYVKRRADAAFLRFDASNAGLTQNCNDYSEYHNENPARPFYTCRILAVAGASPGKAIIGFDSFNIEPQNGALWTFSAGGADAVAFDPVAGTLARKRHAMLGSPPHTICSKPVYGRTATCDPTDWWWWGGRRVFVKVRRIVVNHDPSSPMYGDAWMGGQHATFAAVLENAEARGLVDRTAGWGPEWADAKGTWEHLHPAVEAPDLTFVNGEGWALSIDPRDGRVWGSNEFRTTYVDGPYYSGSLANDDWWQGPFLDLWPDPPDTYFTETDDHVRSMSHCPDGTLWIGSLTHGLTRIDPGGQIAHVSLPDAGGVSAVACDPTDASLWIGPAAGGVLRLRGGTFERVDTAGLPAFTANPVQSIQIDRWSATRTVYFAFRPLTDAEDRIVAGGGVGAYAGP
jgi:hypothetical protein